MSQLDKLRAALPWAADLNDVEILGEVAKRTRMPIQDVAGAFGIETGASRGPISAGLSSGIDQIQGLGYSALGGAADAVGAAPVRDWANRRAAMNNVEGELSGRPDLERVEDQSWGTAVPYAAYQIAKQVPTMAAIMGAEAIPGVGQAAGALGLARMGAAAPRIIGGGGLRAGADFAARRAALTQGEALASESLMGGALGYGSLYGESVEGGNPSPYASALLAVPYGLSEAAVPAAVRGAFRAPLEVSGNLLTRMAKTGGMASVGEAGTETLQNEMEMGMRNDLTPEEMRSRRINSAVAGGLVGGGIGSFAGIPRRTVDDGQFDLTKTQDTTPQGPTPQLGFSPLAGTPIVFPDGSVALGSEQELLRRYGANQTTTALGLNQPGLERDLPGTPADVAAKAATTTPSIAAFDAVDQGLTDVNIPLASGKKTREKQRAFYEAAAATGIPLDSDLLTPYWTAISENRFGDKTKVALQNAIVAHKKEQTNGTPSAPVAATAPSSVGSSPVADGSVGVGGPVVAVDAAGSGVATNPGAAATQAAPVGDTGVQPSTVVNTQQSTDPFQVTSSSGEPVVKRKKKVVITPASQPNAYVAPDVATQHEQTKGDGYLNDEDAWNDFRPDDGPDYKSLTDSHKQVWAELRKRGKLTGAYAQEMSNDYQDEDKAETIHDVIQQIFGKRDGAVMLDAFVNKRTSAQIAEEHGLDRSRVSQMVGNGEVAKKFRDQKIKEAQDAHGWTDEYVQSLMGQLNDSSNVVYDEDATDPSTSTHVEDENDHESNLDVKSAELGVEAEQTLGDLGFSTISSEGGSTGYTDKLQKEDRKKVSPQVLAASMTQQWFETINKADALMERIERARTAGRDTLTGNKGKQSLEEAEGEYVALRHKALVLQQKAELVLNRYKTTASAQAAESTEEDSYETDFEKAAKAWDKVAKDFPDAPKFSELSDDQQQDFIDYGPENWTADDVQNELAKLSTTMEAPAKQAMESFDATNEDIDPSDREIDKELRGKKFPEVVQWALDNTRNEYERAIMRAVAGRLEDLSKRGMKFTFRLTDEGKQLTGGASGTTISTPAGLGEAGRVDIILNGAHVGENSGMNYETLVHELIHAATQAQIKFAPNSSAAKELKELYSDLAKDVTARQKAGKLTEWEKTFFEGNNNSLRDVDELLAWGLTNSKFQEYLNGIQVTPKQSLWDRFVKLISDVLGIPVRANSALARLMSVSENMFSESLDPYVVEANSRFQSLGRQANTTKWPNWSLNPDLGAPVWQEGDYALYRATGTQGGTLYIPGMRNGDSSRTASVDVGSFKGAQIPAADLAKMKAAADGLRQQTNNQVSRNATPKQLQQPVNNLTRVLKAYGNKALNTVMFSQDLFRRAADMGITASKDLGALYQKRAALAGEIERKVIRIEQMFNHIPEDSRQEANQFVRDMRFAKKWAFVPDWRSGAVQVDPDLEKRFDELPAESQAWAQAVFKHGDEMRTLKQDAVRNAFNSEYDARIAEAKKAGDTDKVTTLEKEKTAELSRFKRLFAADERNPYAPVRRFGNWVVVGKSNEYLDAEEAGDKKKMAELETDADHYFVDFRESLGSALKLSQDLESSGLNVTEPREKEDPRNDMYGGLMQAFDKLRGNIESQRGSTTDPDEKKALSAAREVVVDLYLRSLADTSARKSELRFKGVAGDIDMLRSFSSQGRADAHFLAAATFNPQMTDTITKMREQKNQRGGDTNKSMAFKEIMARHEQSMKYTDGGWFDAANKATAVTSAWMLATSPMYYLQNLTQPAVISVPYMTGKHDYGTVWGQLLRAYHEMGPLLKSSKVGEGFDFSTVPADVRDAILELVNRGRIDIGMDTELGKVKLEGDTLASKTGNRLSSFFRTLAQKSEAINRVSTAMAAYRLEMKKSGDAAKALEYADEVLDKTHGDYTAANAPRLFNTPMGKVALQFRKFQLIQLSLLTKMTHDAFKGASPAERAAARKMLAFTLGHTGALAGVVGMPGFAAISFMVNKLADLFGDDDEPYNLENELRKALGGGDFARVVMRGVPMAAGVDISGKVGMGTALSILPYSDMDMTRAGFNEIATGLTLGATGGLGARVWESLGKIKDGDYYRGLAGLMPKGLADAYRAAYEFNNGLLRTNGDTLIGKDEIGTFDSIAKAIGLTTAKESERKFDSEVAYNAKEAFQNRTNQLKTQYIKARRDGDVEGAQKVMQQWQKLQTSRREAGYTVQPMSTLLKAPMEQIKRDRNVSGGVQFDKNSKRFVQTQTTD